jgi:hypothetical protein
MSRQAKEVDHDRSGSLVILAVVGFFAYQWLTFNWVQATAGLGSVRPIPGCSDLPLGGPAAHRA